jgi:hypothetical protein
MGGKPVARGRWVERRKIALEPPQDPMQFFPWLKSESERLWTSYESSFKNSKWLRGLSDGQIADFERAIGVTFPDIYKMYLRCMNGTTECYFKISRDVVLRGGSDATDWYSASESEEVHNHIFHSFPRDLHTIRKEIAEVCAQFKVSQEEVNQREIPHIMPIRTGMFLVIDRCEANPVLSIYPDYPEEGATLFANSLQESLAFNILAIRLKSSSEEPYVKFWVDYDDGLVKCPECGMDTVNPVYSGFLIFKKVIAFSCYNENCPNRGKPFETLIRYLVALLVRADQQLAY